MSRMPTPPAMMIVSPAIQPSISLVSPIAPPTTPPSLRIANNTHWNMVKIIFRLSGGASVWLHLCHTKAPYHQSINPQTMIPMKKVMGLKKVMGCALAFIDCMGLRTSVD
jgi:hypothetical protein